MAVNAIFLKALFVQTVLFAVGIDANGKNLPLAWESESTVNSRYKKSSISEFVWENKKFGL